MTKTAVPSKPRGWLKPIAWVPILGLLTLLFWGLSSPVGSAPDDDFHLASIWCALGDRPNACDSTNSSVARSVPEDLIVASKCYAGDASKSASCEGASFGTHPGTTIETTRGNFAIGLYPPLFYLAMTPFVGPNLDMSVLAMRFLNSVVFIAMMTGLFLLLPAHRRSTLIWAAAVSVIPLGIFLIPSTNPSSWAVTSAATLSLALLGFFETTGKRRIALGAMATLATLIGAGARADSAVYAGIAIVAVSILAARRTRAFALSLILPVALAVIALAFFSTARQSGAGSGINGNAEFGAGLIANNLLAVPSLWVGNFGTWGLGWLDTAMLPVVWIGALGAFCAAVFYGLGAWQRRKSLIVALVFAALWLIPTVVLVQARENVGQFVQPRYVLPLIIMLAGFALLQRRGAPLSPSRAQLASIAVALSAANAVALGTNIRRYVTGVDIVNWNLNSNIEWWWNLAISPMFVWIAGSMTFAAMLVFMISPAWARSSRLDKETYPDLDDTPHRSATAPLPSTEPVTHLL